MPYEIRNYRPEHDYGDEDQNDLMRIIDSWHPDDDEEDDSPGLILRISVIRETSPVIVKSQTENIRFEDDELPF